MVWLHKPKRNTKTKLFYINTDGFFVYVKTIDDIYEDIYKDIAKDVEKRYDTSNYELKRQVLKGKNKKIIGVLKDELGGKITKEFVRLRGTKTKTNSSLTDDDDKIKKA